MKPVLQSALPIRRLFVRLSIRPPGVVTFSYPSTLRHPGPPRGTKQLRASEEYPFFVLVSYSGVVHTRTCAGVRQDVPELTPLSLVYPKNPRPPRPKILVIRQATTTFTGLGLYLPLRRSVEEGPLAVVGGLKAPDKNMP